MNEPLVTRQRAFGELPTNQPNFGLASEPKKRSVGCGGQKKNPHGNQRVCMAWTRHGSPLPGSRFGDERDRQGSAWEHQRLAETASQPRRQQGHMARACNRSDPPAHIDYGSHGAIFFLWVLLVCSAPVDPIQSHTAISCRNCKSVNPIRQQTSCGLFSIETRESTEAACFRCSSGWPCRLE